jgi:hypothetical protein
MAQISWASGAVAVLVPLTAHVAQAQDMEPRAYSAAPIGTNFLLGGYAHSRGGIATDPSVPIENLNAKVDAALAGYSRTFALAGQTANAAVLLPYSWGTFTGDVQDQNREVSRAGIGDLRLRLAANLLGGPALTPEEFTRRKPGTTLGASLTLVVPTGEYHPEHLINIGTNRWAIKPELGLSQPLGNWFADAAAGVWFFTDNTQFFGGNDRSQQPLWSFQAHAGYNFRPGLWLAADVTYYTGGESSINGVDKHDTLANSRYGLTLSIPLADAVSLKTVWSTGLTSRGGADFDTFGVVLQYRWFSR